MAKNPGGQQANTKGSKGSFSAGASPVSGKQTVATGGGGGGGGFFSNLFGGGGNNDLSQRDWARGPGDASMDVITKPFVGGKTAPNYGQQNLGMAAAGTPGLSDKLALNQAAMAAAQEPQGIMGIVQNLMPGAFAMRAVQGVMKHARPASAFAPRYGVDGQLTDYGRQLENQQQMLMADMVAQSRMDTDSPPPAPVEPVAAPDANGMPSERPSWWPSYLPWPPVPNVSVPQTPMAPVAPPPATGGLPAPNPYSTSYSNLQGAISGAQNPLMMGIGGMLRRP